MSPVIALFPVAVLVDADFAVGAQGKVALIGHAHLQTAGRPGAQDIAFINGAVFKGWPGHGKAVGDGGRAVHKQNVARRCAGCTGLLAEQ